MQIQKLKLAILFIFLSVVNTSAQQYCFQSFSLNEGLPQSEVKQIIATNLYTFWVATNGGGVVEFDGKKFSEINFPNTNIDKEIYSLFKDHAGKIYIAGKNRLSIYDGIKLKNFTKKNGYQPTTGVKITENPANKEIILYSRTNNQTSYLAKLQNDSIVSLENEYPLLKQLNILNVFKDTVDKCIYLTTTKGLYALSNSLEKKNLRFKNFENYLYIVPIGHFNDSLFLTLLPKNAKSTILLLKTSEKIEQIPNPPHTNINLCCEIKKDNSGKYWFITNNGIAYYNGHTTVEINKENGLPVSNILSMELDYEGNIWIGTGGAGLLNYCGDEMIRYTENEGLKSNIVRNFYNEDSLMWIATEGGGISKLNLNSSKIINYKNENKPSQNNTYSLIKYKNKLLVGSRGGILEYKNNKFIQVNYKFKLNRNTGATQLYPQNDSLWILPTSGGIKLYYKNKIQEFTKQNGLSSNQVNSLFIDSNNIPWICTIDGINYIKNGEIVKILSENNENQPNIIQAAEDNNGQLWFASFSQGVYMLNKDKRLIPVENLSDNRNHLIYSIIIDSLNNLWLGRQRGIFKYTISHKNKISLNRSWLGNNANLECNGNAAYIDSENKMWFGTIQGAVKISPTNQNEKASRPKIYISDLKLFLNSINWDSPAYSKYYQELIPWTQLPKHPKLPFKLNHISFAVSAIDFKEPNELKCSWFLEGFDSQWSPVSKQDLISYSNLPPGNYIFKIKAVNHQNNWSKIEEFPLEIVEPLWKSTIFQLVSTFTLLLIIVLFVVLRLRRLKRNKEDLELLVSLKTREIMQQNAEILTQNKILERQKERISKTVERLKESYSDLALLNEIGKDISYSLSVQTIIDKVYDNLNTLLDAAIFGIGIYKKETNSLEFISAKEKGKVLPVIHLSLKETSKLAVKCLLENNEIFITDFEDEYKKFGKDPMQLVTQQIPSSLFYVPLSIVDRKIGILTVQSYNKYAYDDYHLNLIRNIAIYTSIALTNAETYEQLKDKTQNLETANNFINEKNKQIEKKNDELKVLNEDKNKLIRIVAHDLRNPLTAGITSLDILLSTEKNISSKGMKQFEYLKRSLWRMNDLIGKILDVRAIEKKKKNIKIEKILVSPILKQLIQEYQKQAESKEIDFKFHPLSTQQYIFADYSYLTQIFDNIISNAVKFSTKNSVINIIEEIAKDNLRISIQNTGQGFKPEELKEIFKTFKTFSSKPTGNEKSSGIGLSIVKKYVDDMDGKVWVESTFGETTTFYLEFDLVENTKENSLNKS